MVERDSDLEGGLVVSAELGVDEGICCSVGGGAIEGIDGGRRSAASD